MVRPRMKRQIHPTALSLSKGCPVLRRQGEMQSLDRLGTKRRGSAFRLFLDLRSIEQRGDDRRRADADRDASLDQLGPPFLARFVAFLAHRPVSMAFGARLEAA